MELKKRALEVGRSLWSWSTLAPVKRNAPSSCYQAHAWSTGIVLQSSSLCLQSVHTCEACRLGLTHRSHGGLNVYVSPIFNVEVLGLKVMVFGGGAFGRCLGHERGALMKGLVPL